MSETRPDLRPRNWRSSARPGDHFGVRRPVVIALVLASGSAQAGRHTVQRGETLEHVAAAYGCSVDDLLRANKLRTTLVRPGTVVDVPACTIQSRSRVRDRSEPRREVADERARRALDVIDGTAPVSGGSESIGDPWDGKLRGGEALPHGDGYRIRRPHRAYGAAHVVDHVQRAIAEVRALYPDVHALAIGDISAPHGGKLGEHRSHQSGLDVDLGFYFTKVPAGYPDSFVAANSDLDLEATWALVISFVRTADQPGGLDVIFLDEAVQARLYRWARGRGVPEDHLAYVAAYVRHWPNHADHLHVRFTSR